MDEVEVRVGGASFVTTLLTVSRSPVLCRLMGGEGAGLRHIDRDPTLFRIILNRLRGWPAEACVGAVEPRALAALAAEARFYEVDVFDDIRFVETASGDFIKVTADEVEACALFERERAADPAKRVFAVGAGARNVRRVVCAFTNGTTAASVLRSLRGAALADFMADVQQAVHVAAARARFADPKDADAWLCALNNAAENLQSYVRESDLNGAVVIASNLSDINSTLGYVCGHVEDVARRMDEFSIYANEANQSARDSKRHLGELAEALRDVERMLPRA